MTTLKKDQKKNRPRYIAIEAPNIIINGKDGLFAVNRNDQFIGRSMIAYGEPSREESYLYEKLLQKDDFVLEPGANIGVHTIGISKAVGSGGQVVAFEPLIRNFQLLATNITLNSLTNVDIHQIGCGDVQGDMPHPVIDYTKSFNFGGVSLANGTDGDGKEFQVDKDIRIPIVTLDDFILQGRHKTRRVKLIKADVEDMEINVLKGAQKIINRDRPILYVENNRPNSKQKLIDFILDLNYDLWWHLPFLFTKENYFNNPKNIFNRNYCSHNMLCFPKEASATINGPRVSKINS